MPTRLAAAVPGGGLPSLPPAYPPPVYFPAPYSPTPFPGGEGGDQGYFMQGAAPLASPGLNPGRHRSRGRTTHPAGVCLRNRQLAAKPIEQPFYWRCRQPRRGGTGGDGTIRRKRRRRLRWSSPPGQIEQVPRGLAFFVACLPTLPLVYFSAPLSPRPPSPAGKGEIFSFLMQGALPLASPGLNPGGTGAGGRIARWRGGLPSLLPAYPAFSLLSCPLSPRPPSPPGKGETQSLFRRGLRPRHPGTEPLAALAEPAKKMPSGGEACSGVACPASLARRALAAPG